MFELLRQSVFKVGISSESTRNDIGLKCPNRANNPESLQAFLHSYDIREHTNLLPSLVTKGYRDSGKLARTKSAAFLKAVYSVAFSGHMTGPLYAVY